MVLLVPVPGVGTLAARGAPRGETVGRPDATDAAVGDRPGAVVTGRVAAPRRPVPNDAAAPTDVVPTRLAVALLAEVLPVEVVGLDGLVGLETPPAVEVPTVAVHEVAVPVGTPAVARPPVSPPTPSTGVAAETGRPKPIVVPRPAAATGVQGVAVPSCGEVGRLVGRQGLSDEVPADVPEF